MARTGEPIPSELTWREQLGLKEKLVADLSDDALRGMEARLAEAPQQSLVADAFAGFWIAEAREDLRLLLAEVRRLREEAEVLKRLEESINGLSRPAHTYSSENADHYRGFDAGLLRVRQALKRIRAEVTNGD